MLIPRNLKIEWQCTLLLKTYFFSTRTTGFSHYCARHKISNEFIEHKNKFFCVVDILTVLCGNSSLSKCVNSKKFEDWMTVQSIVKNIFFRLEKLVFRIAVLDTKYQMCLLNTQTSFICVVAILTGWWDIHQFSLSQS